MRFKPGDIVEYNSSLRVPYAVLEIKYQDGEEKIKVWDHQHIGEPRYKWYPAAWFSLARNQEKAMSRLVDRMMFPKGT